MNKLFALLIVLSIPLVLTACTIQKPNLLGGDGSTTGGTTGGTAGGGANEGVVGTVKESLADIIKKQIPTTCTYTAAVGTESVSNTVYASGGKARNEMTITTGGQTNKTVGITDGGYVYVWAESNGEVIQGMKIKMTADEQQGNNEELQKMQDNYDYKCVPWVADASKFALPTNVQFVDAEAAQKAAEELTKNAGKQMCTYCNTIEDADQKATCIETYSCQ